MARVPLFLAILAGGVALDLWTKALAFDAVPQEHSRPIEVVKDFFYIAHAENDGGMWSLFQGLPVWVWIALRGVVAVLIFVYWLTHPGFPKYVDLAFAFVLAGALGNLHDNSTGNGKVRDFLRFEFWGWPFPTFNAADSMICVGAGLLLIHFTFQDAGKRPANKA